MLRALLFLAAVVVSFWSTPVIAQEEIRPLQKQMVRAEAQYAEILQKNNRSFSRLIGAVRPIIGCAKNKPCVCEFLKDGSFLRVLEEDFKNHKARVDAVAAIDVLRKQGAISGVLPDSSRMLRQVRALLALQEEVVKSVRKKMKACKESKERLA